MPSGPKKRRAVKKKKEIEGEKSPNVAENRPENVIALEKEPALKDDSAYETKGDAKISESEVVPRATETVIPVDDAADDFDQSGTKVSELVLVVQGSGIGQGVSDQSHEEVNTQENSVIDLPTNADLAKQDDGFDDDDDLSRNDRIDQLRNTVIKGLKEAACLSTILQEVLDDLDKLMDP